MLQSHPVIYKAIKHYYIFLRSFTSDNFKTRTEILSQIYLKYVNLSFNYIDDFLFDFIELSLISSYSLRMTLTSKLRSIADRIHWRI